MIRICVILALLLGLVPDEIPTQNFHPAPTGDVSLTLRTNFRRVGDFRGNMPNLKDHTGSRFGRLTVVGRAGTSPSKKVLWLCNCDCGEQATCIAQELTTGSTKSCGCLRREVTSQRATTHGMCRDGSLPPEYHSWSNMIQRCTNPNNPKYDDYGGRGITVCARWVDSFESFLEDMGEKPEGYSVERINNNGNYEPGNCRWATQAEQVINSRHCRMLSFNGKTQAMSVWARELNIEYDTLRNRLDAGWPIGKAFGYE